MLTFVVLGGALAALFLLDTVKTLAAWRLRRRKLRAEIALLEVQIQILERGVAPEGAKEAK